MVAHRAWCWQGRCSLPPRNKNTAWNITALHENLDFFILGALNSRNIFHHFYDHNNLQKNQQVNWQNNFVILMHCWKRCIFIGPEKGRCGLTVTLIETGAWCSLPNGYSTWVHAPQQVSGDHHEPKDCCFMSWLYDSTSNPAHHHRKAAAIDD